MESLPPTLKARFFQSVGWGAKIPGPAGPVRVKSFHFRVPGENGVLTQVFFPVYPFEITAAAGGSGKVRRVYRSGVLRGFSYFSSTPAFLFDILLGASPHPLSGVPVDAKPLVHVDGENNMPVVFFSHGLAGNCEVYTKACSDLAANGFIVVALEHEDGSGSFAKTAKGEVLKYQRPPEGIVYSRPDVIKFRAPFLEKRELEMRTVVNFFTEPSHKASECELVEPHHENDLEHVLSNIHPQKAFLAGHSFGAASSVHISRAWKNRFLGVVLMDPWSFPIPNLEQGVDLPCCSVLSEDFEQNAEVHLTRTLLEKSPKLLCSYYVPGSVHSSFSDTPWWGPSWLAKRFKLRGDIDPAIVQQSFTNVYVGFLNFVLDNREAASLENVDALQDKLMKADILLRPFAKVSNAIDIE